MSCFIHNALVHKSEFPVKDFTYSFGNLGTEFTSPIVH